MDPSGYKSVWQKNDDLDALNRRIHDGVPLDMLSQRAESYLDLLFDTVFPYAKPDSGARVMELGSGVGWIMQTMLKNHPISIFSD